MKFDRAKFSIATLFFAANLSHAEVGWQEIPVQLPPAQQQPGEYMVGAGAKNPFFTLPLNAIQGKWVRFSGAVDSLETGMRFVVNTWLDVERTKMAGRIDEARCTESTTPIRCSATYWVAPDAAAAAAGAWASRAAGRVYDLKVEVAVAESDPSIQRDAQSILRIFQNGYYLRKKVDWVALSNLLAAIPRAPDGQDMAYVAATQIRNRLPDNKHTFIGERTTLVVKSDSAVPVCEVLDTSTFVLTLPGIRGTDAKGTQRYAQAAKSCLEAAAQPRRWVLDLRGNGGGNMYPMLEGLSSLLDSSEVSFFMDADDRVIQGAPLKGDPSLGTKKDLPLIVVLGPHCASSCEAVALALSGRPNTLFVGQATAGFTTANAVRNISPKYFVALTESWMADSCKNKAPERLMPTALIEDVDKKSVQDIMADTRIAHWGLQVLSAPTAAERQCIFSAVQPSVTFAP